MGSIAGSKSFVDETEAVDRILQIVCRDEIAMGITYKVAKEPDAHKEDTCQYQGISLKHIAVMRAMHPRVQRNYLPEEIF